MHSLYLYSAVLIAFSLIPPSVLGQANTEEVPKSIFVDLSKHEGWGPFSPREGYEPSYWTGNFTIAGQNYKVYQLLNPNNPQREQRFLFQKQDSEVTFTESEGLPVFYRYEYIELEGASFSIYGYSEKADQFVLFLKEDVNYVDHGLATDVFAPTFKYQAIDGKQIDLSKYRGQYVLLDFWGTWCGPCLKETPYLKAAYSKYSDKVKFIGIAVDVSEEKVKEYIKEEKIEWAQIFIPHSERKNSKIVSDYNVLGYPSMFLIDPNGKVLIDADQRTRLRGERLSETLEKVLSNN